MESIVYSHNAIGERLRELERAKATHHCTVELRILDALNTAPEEPAVSVKTEDWTYQGVLFP